MATIFRKMTILIDAINWDGSFHFTGVKAIGEIDGRKFIVLIPMEEKFLKEADIVIEKVARNIVESMTIDDIAEY